MNRVKRFFCCYPNSQSGSPSSTAANAPFKSLTSTSSTQSNSPHQSSSQKDFRSTHPLTPPPKLESATSSSQFQHTISILEYKPLPTNFRMLIEPSSSPRSLPTPTHHPLAPSTSYDSTPSSLASSSFSDNNPTGKRSRGLTIDISSQSHISEEVCNSLGIIIRATVKDSETYENAIEKSFPMPKLGKDASREKKALHRIALAEDKQKIVGRFLPKLLKTIETPGESVVLIMTKGKGTAGTLQMQLSELETLQAMSCISTALAFCHQNSIVHRDIKPENIVYCLKSYLQAEIPSPSKIKSFTHKPPVHATLIDFGCAEVIEGRKTHRYKSRGSQDYIGPEDFCLLDKSSMNLFALDIYALGCTFFNNLTGKDFPPYRVTPTTADSKGEEFFKETIEPSIKTTFATLDPKLSEATQNLVLEMVNPDPKKRPTASDVRQKVSAIIHQLHTPTTPTAHS